MSEPPASGTTRPRCLSCSEPHEQDQQYCLECGARLPAAPAHRLDTPLWAWAAVVALATVAIVSGIVVALLASAEDGNIARAADAPATLPVSPSPADEPLAPPDPPIEPPVTVPIEPATPVPPTSVDPPTEPPLPGEPPDLPLSGEDLFPAAPTEPPGDLIPVEPVDPPGLLDPPEPDGPPQLDPSDFEPPPAPPTQPASPPPSGALQEWPASTNGYTVILASIPESRGRAEADARASRARSAGLDEVGVLLSSEYGSLRTGYWVAFAGVHDTLNAARAELAPAQAAGFPSAYTRRVAS